MTVVTSESDRPQIFTPRIARDMADKLHEATGTIPAIDRLTQRLWRITLSNERVHLTVDFKANGRGGYRWAGSTLAIDGQQVPLSDGFDHFIDIWRDPDLGLPHEPAPPGQATLPPLPERAGLRTAPATIRDDYNKICAGLRARGLDPAELLVLGRTGRRWTIAMQYDERTGIHVTYTRNNAGQWGISDRTPLKVVRDGTDHTAEANGDVARAMQLMLHGHPGSGPAPGDGTPASVRPASGTTGERVRKTTVIRV